MPRLTLGPALAVAASVAVVGALLLGISMIEGPDRQRDYRLDEIRVVNLASIAEAANCYWTKSGSLPERLSEMEDALNETARQAAENASCVPGSLKDPESGEPYRYRRLDEARFELCATFSRPSRDERHTHMARRYAGWSHDAGPQCFELSAKKIETE